METKSDAPQLPSVRSANAEIKPTFEKLGLNKANIVLHGWPRSLSNGLRDTLITSVPQIRMESLQVELNLTLLTDFQLVSTLNSIPVLPAAETKLVLASECKCVDATCTNCSIAFEIQVEHQADNHNALHPVTARDIVFPSGKCFIHPDVLDQVIVHMSRDQVLRAKGYVRMGLMEQGNACYMPLANTASLRAPADIRIDHSKLAALDPIQLGRIVSSCPTNVLDIEDVGLGLQAPPSSSSSSKAAGVLRVKRPEKCTLCGRCAQVAMEEFELPETTIQVGEHDGPYSIYVETLPGIDPLHVIEQAMTALRKKLAPFSRLV